MPSFTPGKKSIIQPVNVISERFTGTFYSIWCFNTLKIDPIREIYVELKKRYAKEKKLDLSMIDVICGKTYKNGLTMKKYVLEINWAYPSIQGLDSRIVQSRFEKVSAEIIDELFQQFEVWLEAEDGYATLKTAETAKQAYAFMDSYLISAGLKKPPKEKRSKAEKRADRVAYAKAHPETSRRSRQPKSGPALMAELTKNL
ncbi:hypothetical protein IKG20_02165 [Candidatus Saccharibacteria bacterium]|nr:hypothetical protein [Candidatus Saccharibacteria bacterium]